jgi:hypothetical protein
LSAPEYVFFGDSFNACETIRLRPDRGHDGKVIYFPAIKAILKRPRRQARPFFLDKVRLKRSNGTWAEVLGTRFD